MKFNIEIEADNIKELNSKIKDLLLEEKKED